MNRSLLWAFLLAAPLSGQLDWKRLDTKGPKQTLAAHAFDTDRDRLVVFGGQNGSSSYNTTYEWDGVGWAKVASTGPSKRWRAAMAYDSKRGEMVLFGGGTSRSEYSDTWTWDGTAWNQATGYIGYIGVEPSPRQGAAMVYDSARDVVVLFGGFGTTGDLNDTWEWNGANWTQVFPKKRPAIRGAHRMVYDPVNKVTILHGGFRTTLGRTLRDMWSYDGSNWTEIKPFNIPNDRRDQSLVFDAARGRICLYGGLKDTGTIHYTLGDLWDWNGKDWVSRSPATTKPPDRSSGHAAYDPKLSRIIMFGGTNAVPSTLTDTWALAPVRPATLTPFGKGCAGSAGVPKLEQTPYLLPWLGERFDLRITNAAKAAVGGVFLFGISDKKWGPIPLPLDLTGAGATGCSLFVSIELIDIAGLSNGEGTIPMLMCNCPVFLGLPFFMQFVVMDSAVSRPLKVAFTNAMRIVAGSK
jgi:hypothetical protein